MSDTTDTLIEKSTVSGNQATHSLADATGIVSQSYGAGLYLSGGNSRVVNSTISSNLGTADGDVYGAGVFVKGESTAYIVHTTIASNVATGTTGAYGAGVSHFPSTSTTAAEEVIVLLNSILADNQAVSGDSSEEKGVSCFQTTYTIGGNLVEDTSGCRLDSSLATTSIVDSTDVEAQLGALDAGGYDVATHSLGSSSPARAIASCKDEFGSSVLTDARGVRRDLRCDAGSWEYRDARGTSRR